MVLKINVDKVPLLYILPNLNGLVFVCIYRDYTNMFD